MEKTTDTADPSKVDDKAQDKGSQGDPQGKTSQGADKSNPQDDKLNALIAKIKDLESDNKKYRDKDKSLEKEREEAEKRKLEEQGKYQELIKLNETKLSEYEKKLAEISPLSDEVERYKKANISLLSRRLGALTTEQRTKFDNMVKVTKLTADPLAQLELLDTLFDGIATPQGASGTPASQVGPNPKVEALTNQLRRGTRDEKLYALAELKKMGLGGF